MNLGQIITRLEEAYGPLKHGPDLDPLSCLIATILSQNTSDRNSHRAFASLISRFKTWEEVADAPEQEIAEAIKMGGLAEIKAPRIKRILTRIRDERGQLALDFLAGLPLAEAKAWLTRLPGVGPKTASCVLLFSLGKPALPVDTHVYRVAKRLGLIGPGVSPEKAQELLETQVPPDLVYSFHLNLIEHGRKVCRAQRPACLSCFLNDICPSTTAGSNSRKPEEIARPEINR